MITKETSATKLGFAFLATLLMLVLCSTSSFSRSVVSKVIVAQAPDTLALPASAPDTTDGEIELFSSYVDEMPQFIYKGENGVNAFRQYVQDSVRRPEVEMKSKIQGKMYASFIVEKDGQVSTIKIVRSIGKPFDDEVIRVMTNAPKWIPGKWGGKPTRVPYTLPITFKRP